MSTQLGPAWPGRLIASWMLAHTGEPKRLRLVTGPEPVRINRDRYPARGSTLSKDGDVLDIRINGNQASWEAQGGTGRWIVFHHGNGHVSVIHYGG